MLERPKGKGYDPSVISEPCRATLRNYRLIWNYYSAVTWKAGAANIEFVEGAELPGVAFKTTSLDGVDAREGHPNVYGREKVTFQLANGTSVSGYVYIVRPDKCRQAPVWPKPEYLDLMINGARLFGLPAEHIALLEGYKTEAINHATG